MLNIMKIRPWKSVQRVQFFSYGRAGRQTDRSTWRS